MTRIAKRSYPTLKAWREAQGCGQREAARLLHVSQTTYHRLETGKQLAAGERAKLLMTVTGVPLEVLAGVI